MKKKITIVAVVVLVCVAAMVLSGCWLFGSPFDKVVKSIKKDGKYDSEAGTYTYQDYDIEYNSITKIVYNEQNADLITIIYEDVESGDVAKMYITKEQGNYEWEYKDTVYGEITGNVNIEYNTEEIEFVEFDTISIEVSAEEIESLKHLVRLSVLICIFDFDYYIYDNLNLEVSDFGIIAIYED